MQVKETLNEGLKRAYQITITGAELEAKVNEKLVEAQPEVEMKGFRKGKVPMALMKKQFGPKVMGEAMQEAVDGAMAKHFEDSGDRPAGQPEVKMTNDEWKEGDDVLVDMSYEALPPIEHPDMKKIKLEKLVIKPAKADLDEALAGIAENAQNFEDRKAGSKAKSDDQITIDFSGSVDGEKFDGGTAEDYPLVLGSDSFIPGFEEQLVGTKVDDELDVKVSFPDEYGAEHLAGKEAVFVCKVKAVKEPVKAELNDELAKQFGAEDLADLTKQVSGRMETEYAQAARAVMKRSLLDELDKSVNFDLPPSLVEAEAGQIAHQLWHEDNPEVQGHDHPEIETTDEHKKLAVRRVKLGLLLAEMGKQAKVEVTDAEMQQAVMEQARQYPGQEREYFEFIQQNAQMQQQLRAPLFEDKVIDYAFELAEVTEKEISKDELEERLKALEELDD